LFDDIQFVILGEAIPQCSEVKKIQQIKLGWQIIF
jgi:hypothetical protein